MYGVLKLKMACEVVSGSWTLPMLTAWDSTIHLQVKPAPFNSEFGWTLFVQGQDSRASTCSAARCDNRPVVIVFAGQELASQPHPSGLKLRML